MELLSIALPGQYPRPDFGHTAQRNEKQARAINKIWNGMTGVDTSSCGSNRCYPVPPFYNVRLVREEPP
jgi:hypothetical protein